MLDFFHQMFPLAPWIYALWTGAFFLLGLFIAGSTKR